MVEVTELHTLSSTVHKCIKNILDVDEKLLFVH